jgi:hypothetical protein
MPRRDAEVMTLGQKGPSGAVEALPSGLRHRQPTKVRLNGNSSEVINPTLDELSAIIERVAQLQ